MISVNAKNYMNWIISSEAIQDIGRIERSTARKVSSNNNLFHERPTTKMMVEDMVCTYMKV